MGSSGVPDRIYAASLQALAMKKLILLLLLASPVFATQKYGFPDPHLDDEFVNNYKEHSYPVWVNARGSTATITFLTASTASITTSLEVGSRNAAQAVFHTATIYRDVDGVADGTSNAQLSLNGKTNPLKELAIGFDTTNNQGFLQAAVQGTAFSTMTINPGGGAVNVRGTNTNDNATAGFYGQYVSSFTTFTNFPTTAQWGDLVSMTLTAGDWDVTGLLTARNNTSTGTNIQAGISTTSGNSSTGLVFGDNELGELYPTAAVDSTVSVPGYRQSLSGTTIIYLKFFAGYTVGNPTAAGRLTARRVR